MVRIHQQYHVGLANFPCESPPFLRERRSVDDGGRSDILRSTDSWRNGDLGEDGLDFVRHEDAFDQGSDQAGLASTLVPADADSHWGEGIQRSVRVVLAASIQFRV